MNKISYKNIDLCYRTYGQMQHPPLVLIHGYLESMEIYADLAEALKEDYFIIVPDIPGHGASGVYSENHRLEEMAESVKYIIDDCRIEKVHLIGHSMGGYITMAFRELYPDRLFSFSLLHSHCFPDSETKKLNREREVEMVRAGNKELIVRTSIPNVFATDNLVKFEHMVERSIAIAMKTQEEGIIALLNGMRNRPDRSHLLREGSIPSFLINGQKDNLITHELVEKMMSLAINLKRFDLQNSGHMGFVEEKEKVVEIIRGIAAG